jgi:hypothetical protein
VPCPIYSLEATKVVVAPEREPEVNETMLLACPWSWGHKRNADLFAAAASHGLPVTLHAWGRPASAPTPSGFTTTYIEDYVANLRPEIVVSPSEAEKAALGVAAGTAAGCGLGGSTRAMIQ